MGLETGVNYIGDLNSANPTGTDPKGQGDDHIRNIKKAVKQSFAGFADAIIVTGTDTGAANAYVLTPSPALVSLDAGTIVVFEPANSNTGASTLAVSGHDAKDLVSISGDPLGPNEVALGQPVVARYDGTEFRLVTISKQYADQLAFASSLPAISSGTIYQAVFNDGTGGLWKRALPQSTTSNSGKVLKSAGVDGYPEDSSTWDWDAYQGTSLQSSGFTLAQSHRGKVLLCSNTITVALTAAATLGSKFYCRLHNVGTGSVTIDPSGSETITMAGQSAKTTIVLVPGEGIDIFCDGSNFIAVLVQDAGSGPQFYAYETSAPDYTGTTWTTRPLVAAETNTLGITLSAGEAQSVPPGQYRAKIRTIGRGTGLHVCRLYNVTTGAELFYGEINSARAFNPDTTLISTNSAERLISLSATTSLAVQSYGQGSSSSGGSWLAGYAGAYPLDKLSALWLTRISP